MTSVIAPRTVASALWDMSGFAPDNEDLLGVFTQFATPNGLKPPSVTNCLPRRCQ
ncbi:hypothetical protein [Saccharopolyspora spinosa]|uniref:Uncharacterized protein n=1 Tax=Saccharopolyspora spinosa TaxID=60894 RepID=A0A2N3XPJ4_SACSN|nr:hypothetical protein [Saccharopolyspora spinosa]PKW12607.1 hypothetical protein A8926_0070 [Saccharopolyspora spinosa]